MTEFIDFHGIIDDINDPKKLGRAKVRMINEYSDKVDSNDIPWASVLMPASSSAYLGIGVSPTGLQIGTRVWGIFLDGLMKTKPLIIGSIPIILKGNEGDHSVSSYARGNNPVKKEYLDYEPQSNYGAQYPFNRTLTTKGGHVIELDDTPKSERIHIYHKSGSYLEINPDGSIVTKSIGRLNQISIEDTNIISDSGDVSLISNSGNLNLSSDSDINISTPEGNINISTPEGTVFIGGSIIEIEAKEINISGILKVNGKIIQ